MEHRRVPIGVVAIVYEARPNVTIDAAALCLKSGNAAVLRGSSSAAASNAVLVEIVKEAVAEASLPEGSVEAVAGGGREELGELAEPARPRRPDHPARRGGAEGRARAVAEVPILYAASGNCHVYVDAGADLEMARRIAYNAKVQRPGVCNAAETLLVHEAVASDFLPGRPRRSRRRRRRAGRRRAHARQRRRRRGGPCDRRRLGPRVPRAEDGRGRRRFARGCDRPRQPSRQRSFGGHRDRAPRRPRTRSPGGVDAACVYVNASTRFTDGFEFGMGAEIGNSTQKLHARGPIGLRELTSTKYVLRGTGQTRG